MDDYLYHHGILGQKWGKRNGPPYPLDAEDHSAREKKANYKDSFRKAAVNRARHYKTGSSKTSNSKSLSSKESKDTRKWIDKICPGLDPRTKDQLVIAAKYTGIIAGTAAGAVAISYMLVNSGKLDSFISNYHSGDIFTGEIHRESQGVTINSTGAPYTYKIDELAKFDGKVGVTAAERVGLGVIKDPEQLQRLLSNPDDDIFSYEGGLSPDLVIRFPRLALIDKTAPRRLSCWSTSNAYFLTCLTGHAFGSKSYENLVDFNDFGNLYKHNIKIFDIDGGSASDFVGTFGREGVKANDDSASKLAMSILKNISKGVNLTTDGKRTIGFINAAYRGMTCTHQWNFEIEWGANGAKELFMADGYSGKRYSVMKQLADGSFSATEAISVLTKELYSYNMDSLRFYAPSLSDIDPNVMASVVLGDESFTHSAFYGTYLQHYTGGKMDKNYLQHYGIAGMKWGVRRFQNDDGTLTDAGRRRYGTSLDVNDKSRRNIAEIRLGEARRRLDVAKKNNPTNKVRIAELKTRERSAKRAVKEAKRFDRGADLASRGRTITGERARAYLGHGAAYIGSSALAGFLNARLRQLQAEGRYKPSTLAAAKWVQENGRFAMYSAALINDWAMDRNIKDLKAYNADRTASRSSIKYYGSDEYKDVVNRRKNNG